MNKYYTYLLINPIDNTPIYIGKGCGRRYKRHISMARSNQKDCIKNPHLYRKLQLILASGYNDIKYEFVGENMDEITALALEAAYIDWYGLNNLCNITRGGQADGQHLIGRKLSEETKDKIRRSVLKTAKLPHVIAACKKGGAIHKYNNIIRNYGSIEAYDKHIQLQEDLQLLDDVMRDIRQNIISKENDEVIRVREEDYQRNVFQQQSLINLHGCRTTWAAKNVCGKSNNYMIGKVKCGELKLYAGEPTELEIKRNNKICGDRSNSMKGKKNAHK
jgi:hypothetical protein